jgi:hypothetical protein
MSVSLIAFCILFGFIGLGFFLDGKNRRAAVPLVCGVLLMVVP